MIIFLWKRGMLSMVISVVIKNLRELCLKPCHLPLLFFFFFPVSSDGGTESSALVDDNGSEEDYSYEDLCQGNPRYLQPGGEQLAINEVPGFHTPRRTPDAHFRVPNPFTPCSLIISSYTYPKT